MTTTPTAPTNPLARDHMDAIESAERYRNAGRVLDAVDVLAAAYRQRPSTDLARRIIRLRHEAVQTGAAEVGRDSWPPTFPDPFPQLAGIPEITPEALTTDVLGGSILHHGGVIVRGFVSPERAAELHARVVAALADRDAYGDAESGSLGAYAPFEADAPSVPTERAWVREVGGMLLADAPDLMLDLMDLFRASGAVDAITGYLGERPAFSYNKCVLRRLRESSPTWHQDGAFMGDGIRSVDLWLSLSSCGGDAPAPGLDLVPKRIDDILETGTKGSTFPNSIGQGVIDEVAADAPPQTPAFEPGDAILFDERFVHRSSAGRTFTADRYAVESWFFAPSRFPERYVPILT